MGALRQDDLERFINDKIKGINTNKRSMIGLHALEIANYRGVEYGKTEAYEDVLREIRRLVDA
jgi:hypothetical protein